ncbi:hypothetical protein [Nocardiopsis kunsanensis]|uniref:hypothetical protein n=1 Tax=Nocardiopsis kunsanensis TaxID=141693 RepID=UPI00034745AD|nr:hypothetical protein [Nocardiopsis kunsanensis]
MVGAMAMSGARQLLVGLGLIDRTPPEAVLAEGAPSLLRSVPENRRTALVELAHWGYGGTAGAAYSLLPARLRSHSATGPVYGILVWAAFELGVAPALGLAHAHRSRPAERVALFCDHLLYGVVLGDPPKRPVPAHEEEEGGGSATERPV